MLNGLRSEASMRGEVDGVEKVEDRDVLLDEDAVVWTSVSTSVSASANGTRRVRWVG